MRVVVVNGSGNGMDGRTGGIVSEVLEAVSGVEPVDSDVIRTDALDLGPNCPDCLQHMSDGEESCPFHDVMSGPRQLMDDADLVVFASPIHSFHISASMKRFIDHFAYLIHRPRFFGTPAVLVTTAAGAGHEAALDYLGESVRRWGFHIVGRLGLNGPALERPAYRAKADAAVAEVAADAVEAVRSGEEPSPSLNDLIGFRVARLLVESSSQPGDADDVYWTERGWFDKDWFTDRPVNPMTNRMAAMIEGRIRSGIEKGTSKPVR